MGRIPFPDGIFSKEILGKLPHDFTLIYEGKKYECNKALCALLSTQIQIQMLSDVFLDSYSIPDLPDEIDGDLEQISDFLLGNPLEFSKDDVLFLYIVSSILGISQLEDKLKDLVITQLNSIQLKKVIHQTIFLYQHGGDISYHVKTLANHFSGKLVLKDESSDDESSSQSSHTDDKEEMFRKVPIQILDLMFQRSPELIDANDPKTINFIISIGGRLLRYIKLSKLDKNQISNLIKGSRKINLNYIRKNLADYFNEIPAKPQPSSTSKRLAFLENPFTGIINYLSQKCKSNPASSKGNLITVTSSPPIRGSYSVNNIFDYNASRSSFKTEVNAEMTFTIDFRDSRVQIDAYSIKCFPQEQGGVQPTTWKLFGSVDNENWELIDQKRNVILEQCPDTTKTFVLIKKTEKFRYVKYLHPPIKNEKFGLYIVSFELFGVYHEK